jgi:hypothetical protein
MGVAKLIAEAGSFKGFAGTPPNAELNRIFKEDMQKR